MQTSAVLLLADGDHKSSDEVLFSELGREHGTSGRRQAALLTA